MKGRGLDRAMIGTKDRLRVSHIFQSLVFSKRRRPAIFLSIANKGMKNV